MESVLLLKLFAASVFFCDTLLSLLFLKIKGLLPRYLLLMKSSLAFKLISLTLEALLFKLCDAFLFSSGCGKPPSLRIFLLQSDPFGLFLFLAKALFSFKLLSAKAKLFFVALSLEPSLLFQLSLIEFGELSLDLRLILFSLTIQTGALLVKLLPAGGLLSLVSGAISLI